jgi:hypothetical protein
MAGRAGWAGGILSVAHVGSAALGLLVSVLWWRSDVNRTVLEYCPDGFCFLGERFHVVLTRWDAASLRELHRFALTYLHAHSPLGPLLQAGVRLVVGHEIVAYMLVSAAATLVAWLCVRRTIERPWPLPPGLGALLFAAFATHVLVVRAFGRPITDALGMACTAAALLALTRYQHARTAARGLALLAAELAGLFARVSFIPMLGMPALAELAGAGPLAGRLRRAVVAGALYGLLPGALYLGLHAAAGTLHSIPETWSFAHRPDFTQAYTLGHFLDGAVLAVQGYAVLLLALFPRGAWAEPAFRIHLAWVGLYLAFLGLGGGALWSRYFLPVVPSVFVLAAPVLAAVPRAWNVRLLLAAFVAGNLLYAVGQLGSDPGLPGRILANDLRRLVWPAGDGSRLGRLDPSAWTLTASHRPHRAGRAADGRLDTSWATRRPQEPGMYVQVDLGAIHAVTGVWLWSPASEHPRRYTVEASVDGTAWDRLAAGRGDRRLVGFLHVVPAVAIRFAARPARHLRITQDGRDLSHGWAIAELAVATPAR